MKTCKCGAPLVALRSLNLKLCPDCLAQYPFHLKPGQKPLIKGQR